MRRTTQIVDPRQLRDRRGQERHEPPQHGLRHISEPLARLVATFTPREARRIEARS